MTKGEIKYLLDSLTQTTLLITPIITSIHCQLRMNLGFMEWDSQIICRQTMEGLLISHTHDQTYRHFLLNTEEVINSKLTQLSQECTKATFRKSLLTIRDLPRKRSSLKMIARTQLQGQSFTETIKIS